MKAYAVKTEFRFTGRFIIGAENEKDARDWVEHCCGLVMVIERIGWSRSKNRITAWLVRAYRIVDAEGKDLVHPYDRTKREARETAKALGIRLIEQQ